MQYLMFICVDPDHTADDAAAAPDVQQWWEDLSDRGVWQAGDRLRPPQDALTVRVRGGQRLVTDGPFAETKEWICGFDVIECATLDEAVEAAAGHPMAYGGRIEIRPIWPMDAE